VGERPRYERDADGKVTSLFFGGYRTWPIEDYRAQDELL
jgi:hypothetical protein